jgi:hypothetical protein
MPKKTKKQKIISQYRKKLKMIQRTNQVPTPAIVLNTPPNDIEHPITKEQPQALSKEDASLVFFFKSDLKKSLALIFFMIALEFFLYFATIKNYLKLF